MVKKQKKLLQSSWLRRSSVLMSCALILICSVSPAFAAGLRVDDVGQTKHRCYLFGTCTTAVRFGSYNSTQYSTHFDVGGEIANLPITGTNYNAEEMENYHGYATSDFLDYSLYTDINLSRRKQAVVFDGTEYKFDKVRYNIFNQGHEWDLDNDILGDNIISFYTAYTLNFEPFYMKYNADMFEWLIILRLSLPYKITYSYDLSFVQGRSLVSPGNLVTKRVSDGPFVKGNSNIETYSVLGSDYVFSVNGVDEGDMVLISNLTVTCTPFADEYEISTASRNYNSFAFELLSAQYNQAIPVNMYFTPIYDFFNFVGESWVPDLPDNPGGGSGGGSSPIDPEIGSMFTRFLASSVSGFFDVEIMPGFSLGGVMAAIIAVVIVLLLLKFFSGG